MIFKKKLPSSLNTHARKLVPNHISAANLKDVQLTESPIEIHTKKRIEHYRKKQIFTRDVHWIQPQQLLSQERIPFENLASANIKIGTLDLHFSTEPLDKHTIYQTIDTKSMKISPAYFIGDRKISDSDAKTTMTSLDPSDFTENAIFRLSKRINNHENEKNPEKCMPTQQQFDEADDLLQPWRGYPSKREGLKMQLQSLPDIVKEKWKSLINRKKHKKLLEQLNKEAPSNQHESHQLTTQHPPIMTVASLINQLLENTTHHEPTICVYGSHIDPTKTKEATDIDIRWICKNTEEVNSLAQKCIQIYQKELKQQHAARTLQQATRNALKKKRKANLIKKKFQLLTQKILKKNRDNFKRKIQNNRTFKKLVKNIYQVHKKDIRSQHHQAYIIQKNYKEFKAKHQQKAATLLQKTSRRFLEKKKYNNQKKLAHIVQPLLRRKLAYILIKQMKHRNQQKAATILQKTSRGFLAKNIYHQKKLAQLSQIQKQEAATILQKITRRFLAKNIYHQKKLAYKLACKINPLVKLHLEYIRSEKIKEQKAATTLQKTARYYLKQKKTKNILTLDHTIHSKIPLIIVKSSSHDSYTVALKSSPQFSTELSSKNFTLKGKLKEDAQQSLKSTLLSQIQEACYEKFQYPIIVDIYGNQTIDLGFNIHFDEESRSFKESIDASFLIVKNESPFHRVFLMSQLLETINSYIYAYKRYEGLADESIIVKFLNEALSYITEKISKVYVNMIEFSTDSIQLGITKRDIIQEIESLLIRLLSATIGLLYHLLHKECKRYVECTQTQQEYRCLFQKNNTQYIEFLTKYGEMINSLLEEYTNYYKRSEWKEFIKDIKINNIKPMYSLINNWYQVKKSFETFKNIQASDVVIENPINEHLICSLLDPSAPPDSFNFKQSLLVASILTPPRVAKIIQEILTETQNFNQEVANAKAHTETQGTEKKESNKKGKTSTKKKKKEKPSLKNIKEEDLIKLDRSLTFKEMLDKSLHLINLLGYSVNADSSIEENPKKLHKNLIKSAIESTYQNSSALSTVGNIVLALSQKK